MVTLALNVVALRVVRNTAKPMNDLPSKAPRRAPTDWKAAEMQRRIRKRYGAERRFRLVGLVAILLSPF
jgi:hypothetical protein